MARLKTWGYEIGFNFNSNQDGNLDGTPLSGADADRNVTTEVVRSGAQSLKCSTPPTSGGGAAYVYMEFSDKTNLTVNSQYYFRAYMYFKHFPAIDVAIMGYQPTLSTSTAGVAISSGGAMFMYRSLNPPVQVGASTQVVTGVWYRVEFRMKLTTSSTADEIEFRLDGVSIVSSVTQNYGNVYTQQFFRVGWDSGGPSSPGLNRVMYLDDVAVNTSSGSIQNSWCGDGKVVLLTPVSDNTVGTGWVDGDGAGTLFGSVDNIPPIGAAVPAGGTQIKNLTSTAVGNYDANMTTYTNAGITASDTITVVQGLCCHAESIAAGTKAGALMIVSNPVGAAETSFNYGNDQGAMTAWSVDFNTWSGRGWTDPVYNPSVVLGTSPVLRVGKRTATAAEVDVCFMGMYVEYQPGAPVLTTPHRLSLMGVGH